MDRSERVVDGEIWSRGNSYEAGRVRRSVAEMSAWITVICATTFC